MIFLGEIGFLNQLDGEKILDNGKPSVRHLRTYRITERGNDRIDERGENIQFLQDRGTMRLLLSKGHPQLSERDIILTVVWCVPIMKHSPGLPQKFKSKNVQDL